MSFESDTELASLERAMALAPDDPNLAQRYLAVCDRVHHEISTDVRNRILLVANQARIPENLRDILEQYAGNLRRLTSYGIVTPSDIQTQLPYITGIDGNRYAVPTFQQVITNISEEDKRIIETLGKDAKLLLTAFARSNRELGQQITSQTGSLPRQYPLNHTWNQNADRTGDLLYGVNGFIGNIGGLTKQQILELPGDKNPFPGWRVMVVDGKPEIDWQTILKEGGGHKNAHDFLEEYQGKGWDGLTPEDWLALHMLAMETGIPFERQSWCWLLSCYLKSARAVPNADWDGEFARVFLDRDGPGGGWGNRGSRGARRVGSGR